MRVFVFSCLILLSATKMLALGGQGTAFVTLCLYSEDRDLSSSLFSCIPTILFAVDEYVSFIWMPWFYEILEFRRRHILCTSVIKWYNLKSQAPVPASSLKSIILPMESSSEGKKSGKKKWTKILYHAVYPSKQAPWSRITMCQYWGINALWKPCTRDRSSSTRWRKLLKHLPTLACLWTLLPLQAHTALSLAGLWAPHFRRLWPGSRL